MKARLWFVGLLFCWLCGIASADTWQYTIRPGDDLWSLAKKYCGSSNLAPQIAQHNNLQNPAALRVGQRIAIPTDWLVFEPSAARAVQVIGDVYLEPTAGRARTTIKVGDVINMGTTLVTTETAAAQIEFADGSTIAIQAGSRVLFNKLTAFGPAGMVDTHLRFSYGRGEVSVKPQNRGDRFRIQTPEGTAAVRGTTFRIGHNASPTDASGISNSETLTGAISFRQATNQIPVPAGFGVAASNAGVTKEELLAPPDVPAYTRVAVDQELTWASLPGAAEYVASWIAHATPEVIYRQLRVDKPTARVNVEPGTYEFRVRGVSASRIEGFDHVQMVTVASPAPQLTLATDPFSNGTALLEWVATRDGPYSVIVNGENLAEPVVRQTATEQLELSLPPGRYTWTVASSNSITSQPAEFTILPERPISLRATGQRKTDGNMIDLRWSAPSNTDQFDLQVIDAGSGTVVYQQTVSGQAHQFRLDDFGHFTVHLTAQENDLRSEPATTHVSLYRRPWWLFILLLPVAAL